MEAEIKNYDLQFREIANYLFNLMKTNEKASPGKFPRI